MRKLELITPYGDRYYIHDNGAIERADMPGQQSGQWKLLGLQHVRRREFIPLGNLLAGEIPALLLYKNGWPQWTVRDLDHGTTREWGNTHAHGVLTLRELKPCWPDATDDVEAWRHPE